MFDDGDSCLRAGPSRHRPKSVPLAHSLKQSGALDDRHRHPATPDRQGQVGAPATGRITQVWANVTQGLPQLQVEIHRQQLAQYVLNVSDVNRVLEAALGGRPVSSVNDGNERYEITVTRAHSDQSRARQASHRGTVQSARL